MRSKLTSASRTTELILSSDLGRVDHHEPRAQQRIGTDKATKAQMLRCLVPFPPNFYSVELDELQGLSYEPPLNVLHNFEDCLADA